MNLKKLIIAMKGKTDAGIGFFSSSDEYSFLTYHQLYEKIQGKMSMLYAFGMKKNDKVLFQIKEMSEYLSLFWACIAADMIPIPVGRVNNKESLHCLEYIYHYTDCYLVYDEYADYLKKFPEAICMQDEEEGIESENVIDPVVEENQIAYIQYSSGSTGNPKGIVLSHDNIMVSVQAVIDKLHITSADSSISWMPLYHNMGLIGFHVIPTYMLANHYLMSTQLFMTKPEKWIAYIDQFHITMTGAPNFGVEKIANYFENSPELVRKYNLHSLRILLDGSELVSTVAVKRFYRIFQNAHVRENIIYPVYGLTEGTIAVAFPEENEEIETLKIDMNQIMIGGEVRYLDPDKPGAELVCVGSALQCVQIGVYDDEGNLLEENKYGHIYISGKSVAKNYMIQNKYAPITEHNRLNTGDIGFWHEGKLYIIGRENEMVVNGRNYYLTDAEAIIKQFFSEKKMLIEGLIITIYEEGNYQPILFVKGSYQIENMRLIEELKSKIKKETGISIRGVLFVNEFLYTGTGKIKRLEMRSQYAKNMYENKIIYFRNTKECEVNNCQHAVVDLFQATFGFMPNENEKLSNYDLESVYFYIYIGSLEECFHVSIEMEQIWDCDTLNDISEKVQQIVYEKNGIDEQTIHEKAVG